jgi:hypothetical protein
MRALVLRDSDFTETYTVSGPAFSGAQTPREMPTVTLSTFHELFITSPARRTWNEVMERVLEEDADLWQELAAL